MPIEPAVVSAHTEVVCILGHPVRHSFSPCIHNAAFRAQNVDMVYLAFDVRPARLEAALDGLRALGFRGANLTLPHKEAAVALVDEVDPVAARLGAINTIVNDRGRLKGYNTDVAGFAASLHSVLPGGARDRRCVVIGAGGAARAVLAGIKADRPLSVQVCNRTQVRALSLCHSARSWGLTECEAIPWEERHAAAASADLIVNATSLGLTDAVKDFPVDVDTLHSGQVVVDVVYGNRPSDLVRAARAKGAVAIDGREMLVMQAADAYKLWTGKEPPVETMRRALEHCKG